MLKILNFGDRCTFNSRFSCQCLMKSIKLVAETKLDDTRLLCGREIIFKKFTL